MNQPFSAQLLTRKPLPLHEACTERSERVEGKGLGKQAAPKNTFQNEMYLKCIAANAASGAQSSPPRPTNFECASIKVGLGGLEKLERCNRLETHYYVNKEKQAMVRLVLPTSHA